MKTSKDIFKPSQKQTKEEIKSSLTSNNKSEIKIEGSERPNYSNKLSPSVNQPEQIAQHAKNIKVIVRVRPLSKREISKGMLSAWEWKGNSIRPSHEMPMTHSQNQQLDGNGQSNKNKNKSLAGGYFAFDHLYTPDHHTQRIYNETARGVVLAAMDGFHGSVCAYGQTSTGKTFSMQGTNKQPGIIPLAVNECFGYIGRHEDREFLLRVSYLEIYNECLNDLLSPTSTNIKILDDKRLGVVVKGLKEDVVISPVQAFAKISAGEAQRHVGSTDANAASSRSHTIFRLTVESRKRHDKKDASVRVSTLQLVDLAGSESVRLTNSVGDRQKEGGFINKSLLTLGTVIRKLSDSNCVHGHIPYRDSKLTRILQPSLGGNAQIAIICTLSPSVQCYEESMNTMKFALRAKRVKQDAVVNEVTDQSTMLRHYEKEIVRLKEKLAQAEAVAQEHTKQSAQSTRPLSNLSSNHESLNIGFTLPKNSQVNGVKSAGNRRLSERISIDENNQHVDTKDDEVNDEDDDEGADELYNAIRQLENLILSSKSGSVISAIKTNKKQIHAQQLQDQEEEEKINTFSGSPQLFNKNFSHQSPGHGDHQGVMGSNKLKGESLTPQTFGLSRAKSGSAKYFSVPSPNPNTTLVGVLERSDESSSTSSSTPHTEGAVTANENTERRGNELHHRQYQRHHNHLQGEMAPDSNQGYDSIGEIGTGVEVCEEQHHSPTARRHEEINDAINTLNSPPLESPPPRTTRSARSTLDFSAALWEEPSVIICSPEHDDGYVEHANPTKNQSQPFSYHEEGSGKNQDSSQLDRLLFQEELMSGGENEEEDLRGSLDSLDNEQEVPTVKHLHNTQMTQPVNTAEDMFSPLTRYKLKVKRQQDAMKGAEHSSRQCVEQTKNSKLESERNLATHRGFQSSNTITQVLDTGRKEEEGVIGDKGGGTDYQVEDEEFFDLENSLREREFLNFSNCQTTEIKNSQNDDNESKECLKFSDYQAGGRGGTKQNNNIISSENIKARETRQSQQKLNSKERVEISGAALWADELEKAEQRNRSPRSLEPDATNQKRRSKSGPHPAQLHWRSESDPAFIQNIHRDLLTPSSSPNAAVVELPLNQQIINENQTVNDAMTSRRRPSTSSSSSQTTRDTTAASTITRSSSGPSSSSSSSTASSLTSSGAHQIDEIMRSSFLDNRAAMVAELDRIRKVLKRVLTKIDRNNTNTTNNVRVGNDGGAQNAESIENMQVTMEELRKQLEEQEMANSLRIADSAYLEQQLKEKTRALDQCLRVVEVCEEKQRQLEVENKKLSHEMKFLRKTLGSREDELRQLRGSTFDFDEEETY